MALISVRQTTAESKWAGTDCPKCNLAIQAGQPAVLCPKCYKPHHLDCWNDNGKKCAIDGTEANVLERVARTEAPAAAAAIATTLVAAAPAAPTSPVAAPGAVAVQAAAASPAATTATAASTATAAATSRSTPPRAAAGGGGAPPAARPTAAGGAAASRTAMRSAARRSQTQLTVWPHLLMPEFLASALLGIGLTVMAWFLNAPLEEHANPNQTPSPSKAPWYFLNLQELLLHMHPALAGVIIPTLAVVLLMAIPYLDISTDEVGVWFGSARGKRVFWISLIYTSVLTTGLILFDKFVGLRALIEGAIPFLKTSWISEIVTQTMVPTTVLFIVAMGLYALIAHVRPTVRDVMIAYFTAFAVAWVLMALIGSAFRGPAQELYWPWSMPGRTAG